MAFYFTGRVTVTVPAKFYEDHRARDCGYSDRILKETKTSVTVSLDMEGYNDLYSDADYYAGFGGEDFQWNRGICLSAKATLKALKKFPIASA